MDKINKIKTEQNWAVLETRKTNSQAQNSSHSEEEMSTDRFKKLSPEIKKNTPPLEKIDTIPLWKVDKLFLKQIKIYSQHGLMETDIHLHHGDPFLGVFVLLSLTQAFELSHLMKGASISLNTFSAQENLEIYHKKDAYLLEKTDPSFIPTEEKKPFKKKLSHFFTFESNFILIFWIITAIILFFGVLRILWSI